jgi:hypothetical protein
LFERKAHPNDLATRAAHFNDATIVRGCVLVHEGNSPIKRIAMKLWRDRSHTAITKHGANEVSVVLGSYRSEEVRR